MNDNLNNSVDHLDSKFTHAKYGYSPEEVDAEIEAKKKKMDMLSQQSSNLINENAQLVQVLNECNVKIQQLTQSTQRMENERHKEKLRIAEIMTTASKTAEDTMADAQCKAAEIIADANLTAEQYLWKARHNAKAVHEDLMALIQIIQTTRESTNQHYDRMDAVLRRAEEFLNTRPEPTPTPVYAPSPQKPYC